MTRFLLDSNALAHCIFRRRGVDRRVREHRQLGHIVGTAIPAVAEILGGAEFSSTRDRNLKTIRRHLNQFVLWPFSLYAASIYAQNYADLRRRGLRIQPIDLMIASVALELGNCRVVTSDSDFSRIDSLNVEDWTDST